MSLLTQRVRSVLRAYLLIYVERARGWLLTQHERAYMRLEEKECELRMRRSYLQERLSRVEDYLQRQEHSVERITVVFMDAHKHLLLAEQELDAAGEATNLHTYVRKYA